MFTGIVQGVGVVESLAAQDGGLRVAIATGGTELPGPAWQLGESVAVDGVCLTLVEQPRGDVLIADVSDETLRCTTLGNLYQGARVNLERSVTPETLLGGHLVTGHVDGVGTVTRREPAGGSERWAFQVPDGLARYIAVKGSVTVAGVSLTVNAVTADAFEVNLIPHTLAVTTLGGCQVDDEVNIEVDRIARYVERLMAVDADGQEQ